MDIYEVIALLGAVLGIIAGPMSLISYVEEQHTAGIVLAVTTVIGIMVFSIGYAEHKLKLLEERKENSYY